MGRAVTSGQLINITRQYYTEPSTTASLSEYIAEKVNLLHEFCYHHITEAFFDGCKNEIQVDQRARTVLF